CVIACGCVSVIDNGGKEGNHIVKPNNILQQKLYTYGGIHISRAFIIRICEHANNTYQNSFDCVNW
ncbi:hypothetical protein ALC57_01756, partial [Trachymyrmex cornetzi]